MAFFATKENRIRCGRCNTEFDLAKNPTDCPLCGFGKSSFTIQEPKTPRGNSQLTNSNLNERDYLSIPPNIKLEPGRVLVNDEDSGKVGFWGMVNDYFSSKAVLRINANMLYETKKDYISLFELMEMTKNVMKSRNLNELKGFPNNVDSESSLGRLVYHFIKSFNKAGLFEIKLSSKNAEKEDVWNEKWENILIRPTQEGLEFAQLKNGVFDEGNRENQVLTKEESEWLIKHFKKVEKEGFKEFLWLNEVYLFLKKGRNGRDLLKWYKENPSFISYVKSWSTKKDSHKEFEKQINNLAQMFSAGKISLLRELGIVNNKRNDYTIIGDLK